MLLDFKQMCFSYYSKFKKISKFIKILFKNFHPVQTE